MTFVNTDGMAFIGPGSEWFWTALSGLVLATTFIAIYRQLRLQRSLAAIEQVESFEREWASERMCRLRVETLVAFRDTPNPSNLDNPSAGLVALYWEKVATLVRGGYIDHKLIWQVSAENCVPWWIILGPSARRLREEWRDPTVSANFEWLAEAMAELRRRAGSSSYTEANVAAGLATRIATNLEAIRIEESLRTIILQSPGPATVGQAAPAAPAASTPAPPTATTPAAGPD